MGWSTADSAAIAKRRAAEFVAENRFARDDVTARSRSQRDVGMDALEVAETPMIDIVGRRLSAEDVGLALDAFRVMADVFDEGSGPLSAAYVATLQRRGIGRRLVRTLCSEAASAGVPVAFVPADVEDEHAIAFYHALAGEAASVTIFTFGHQEPSRRAAT